VRSAVWKVERAAYGVLPEKDMCGIFDIPVDEWQGMGGVLPGSGEAVSCGGGAAV
jgi:hypothetical protein